MNKLKNPSHIQTFEDVPIDLLAYRGIYNRYLELVEKETEIPAYGKSNLQETIKLTKENPIYKSMFTPEEQEDILENMSFEFQQGAKEKLRQEFPIIDQLILNANLTKNNKEVSR